MPATRFRNREDAARQLAAVLDHYRGQHPLVLAIPRGGVPMGRIIADSLDGDLDVVLVRKIGAPSNPEFAIGAVDELGTVMLNSNAGWLDLDKNYVNAEAQRQLALIRERRQRYGAGRPSLPASGRTVIVVDDGLATGATMLAALHTLRAQRPAHLVCAVPVAAASSLEQVRQIADEVVCLSAPEPFRAVGLHYDDFSEVDDDDVSILLAPSAGEKHDVERSLRIMDRDAVLHADLVIPPSPAGLVLFAHGSGSSRHSSRNRFVAQVLQRHGMATLLMDLLTPEEDADRNARFDISLLKQRLEAALRTLDNEADLKHLPVGLFGASTGAAAALAVAARHPDRILAVVSRGGRPDLAGNQYLAEVWTPTLLIVGGQDNQVLELNLMAQALMGRRPELSIVPGATHLFEEPGTLEQAAELAANWFVRYLPGMSPAHAKSLQSSHAHGGPPHR